DHKFDPFTQKDYYRVLAAFEPLKRPQLSRADLDREVYSEEEWLAFRTGTAKADAEAKPLQDHLDGLKIFSPDLTAEARRAEIAELQTRIDAINAARPKPLPRAYVWIENNPKAPPTHI